MGPGALMARFFFVQDPDGPALLVEDADGPIYATAAAVEMAIEPGRRPEHALQEAPAHGPAATDTGEAAPTRQQDKSDDGGAEMAVGGIRKSA